MWEQSKGPSTDERINQTEPLDTMEYDQVIKRNGVLTHTPPWVDLENITLRDTSQSRRTRYCMIPCIQNVQNRQIYTNKKISS